MADIVTQWALDASRFQAGLRRAEQSARKDTASITGFLNRQAEQSASQLARLGFGAVSATALLLGAKRAVDQYAAAFPELTRGYASAARAQKDFTLGIGRDLAPVINELSPLWTSFVDGVSDARDAFASGIAVRSLNADPNAIRLQREDTLANELAISSRQANIEARDQRRADRERAFQEAAENERRSQESFADLARRRRDEREQEFQEAAQRERDRQERDAEAARERFRIAEENSRAQQDAADNFLSDAGSARGIGSRLRRLQRQLASLSAGQGTGFGGGSASAYGLDTLGTVASDTTRDDERTDILESIDDLTREQNDLLRRLVNNGFGLAP